MQELAPFEIAPEAIGEPWATGEDHVADAYSAAYDAAEREAADATAFEAAALAAAEADAAVTHERAIGAGTEAGQAPSASGERAGEGEPDVAPSGATEARDADDTADRAREALLDEAARRLTIPEDPTVLSYLLSGIVQVESIRRQGLLEMPTTELRLVELAHLLEREIALLERGLGTYTPDPRLASLRRN
jgi:hypothetical protein